MTDRVDIIPITFAGPIIDAWSRTGNIGRLVRDAVANAKREKRMDDVTLYRASPVSKSFRDFK